MDRDQLNIASFANNAYKSPDLEDTVELKISNISDTILNETKRKESLKKYSLKKIAVPIAAVSLVGGIAYFSSYVKYPHGNDIDTPQQGMVRAEEKSLSLETYLVDIVAANPGAYQEDEFFLKRLRPNKFSSYLKNDGEVFRDFLKRFGDSLTNEQIISYVSHLMNVIPEDLYQQLREQERIYKEGYGAGVSFDTDARVSSDTYEESNITYSLPSDEEIGKSK